MFASSDFGIAQSPCIGLHCPISFDKLARNLTICQWDEKQSVSNTDAVCATSCSVKTKESSMHALLTLLLRRGMK